MSRLEKQRAWRQRERMKSAPHRIRTSGIPARYWDKRFDDYRTQPHTEAAYDVVADWMESFGVVPEDKKGTPFDEWPPNAAGVALLGSPGQTKTTLLCLAAVDICRRGYSVRFITLADWVALCQRMMRHGSVKKAVGDEGAAQVESDFMDDYELDWEVRDGAHLVILDDVGREHHGASGWAGSEFDKLIRHRYDLGLCTSMTSNLALNRWADEYSPGMRSFVQEACRAGIVTISGPDMREQR